MESNKGFLGRSSNKWNQSLRKSEFLHSLKRTASSPLKWMGLEDDPASFLGPQKAYFQGLLLYIHKSALASAVCSIFGCKAWSLGRLKAEEWFQ